MDAFVETTLPRQGLTDDERASLQDILDCAYAWSRGEMPIEAVQHLGIVPYKDEPSPAYSRWLAIGTTSKTDPRWAALNRLIDHLIRHDPGLVVTRQGVFQPLEMTMHHRSANFVRDNPREAA